VPSIALLLLGLGLYLLLWFNPESGVPNPRDVGEWRSVPTGLRPLFRRGSGPVLIAALLWQVSGLFMIAIAVLWLTGLLSEPVGAVVAYLGGGSVIVASLGSGWLAMIDRSPRR
jgi:hypothetical protein